MSQFKKAQVIMLPTTIGENFPILKSIGGRGKQLYTPTKGYYYTQSYLLEQQFKAQHLYIVSDEKIEDNDWYIWQGYSFKEYLTPVIYQAINTNKERLEIINNGRSKKIIATTDTSLINIIENYPKPNQRSLLPLPQPSSQFTQKYIEEYNKGNVIKSVLVEYESINSHVIGLIRLKVNPKDNTITIKKIKDSWNREEVIEILHVYGLNLIEQIETKSLEEQVDINKWIEENL